MQHAHRIVLTALSVLFLLSSSLVAAEKAEKSEKAKAKGKKVAATQAVRVPKGIELNEEQKTKVDELNKSYGPKVTELQKKLREVLTPEQQQARADAAKSIKSSDKKGKEAREALDAAVKLTDEQKKQEADLKKELNTLQKEIQGKFTALLTAEQKSQLKPAKTEKPKKPAAK
jgi:Spy/CpxP family protein refolding chaperone